jgi:hypothetical protein
VLFVVKRFILAVTMLVAWFSKIRSPDDLLSTIEFIVGRDRGSLVSASAFVVLLVEAAIVIWMLVGRRLVFAFALSGGFLILTTLVIA